MAAQRTFAALILTLSLLIGCDSNSVLDVPEERVPLSDPAALFRTLPDSMDFIWQNESLLSGPSHDEFTRSSLIVFLDSTRFGGNDGCQFFIADLEVLETGQVRLKGMIDYPECPGGFDLRADTFDVYLEENRIAFESDSQIIALRANYTADATEVGLAGQWERAWVRNQDSGEVLPHRPFSALFRDDSRLETRATCSGGSPVCTSRTYSFFGISKDRFLIYDFDDSRRAISHPEDHDVQWTSFYHIDGDSLFMWGSPLNYMHAFIRDTSQSG